MVLVASAGGHLKELMRLRPALGEVGDDVLWVTFDTAQAALLAGEAIVFARHTNPRDYRGVVANLPLAWHVLDRGAEAVISTGSGIALSFIPLARARGIPAYYIESSARVDGPSLTGRILQRVPGVRLYTQNPGWAGDRWRYGGSVLDSFEPARTVIRTCIRRAVVALGILDYDFRRLVERLIRIIPSELAVLWQTGNTRVEGLPIQARPWVPDDALARSMADANVVICQAGCGSILSALEAGHCPVVVPRLSRYGENVDDHQAQFAAEVARRGLGLVRSVETLTYADLLEASGLRVVTRSDPPPFRLRTLDARRRGPARSPGPTSPRSA
jgi:UDP-N-acetylglucosamine transferase subunit ALG13